MTRSKFSIKAALLAGGIGLSMAGFADSQPAAAQSYSDEYSCPARSVYDLTYGCTLPGATYDTYGAYGTYGYYAPTTTAITAAMVPTMADTVKSATASATRA